MLYLCDNQALPKAANRWVGKGGKATLVGVPDADILREAIEEFRKTTTARAATFLVRVKRIEENMPMKKPISKQTWLFQAKMFHTEWRDGTNRGVFTWQVPCWKGGTVGYEDPTST